MYTLVFIILAALVLKTYTEQLLALSCEGETMHIECNKGQAIHIASAMYGKTDPRFCRSIGETINNCKAGNALDVVKFKCNRKQYCHVNATNTEFGDPCAYVHKYLQVEYECSSGEIVSEIACENDKLEISCPEGANIWIANAIYGRVGQLKCGGPDKQTRHNYCYANNSLTIVEQKCDNLPSCTIMAGNSVFGDPCFGTYKYLEVLYQCQDSLGDAVRPIENR